MEYRELGSQKLTNTRRLSQTRGRYDSTERQHGNHFQHATSVKRHTRCVKSCDLSGRNTNTKQNDNFGKSDQGFQQHAHHRNKRHELWIQHKREQSRQEDHRETEETTANGQTHRALGKFRHKRNSEKYPEKHQQSSRKSRGDRMGPPFERVKSNNILSGVLVYGLTKIMTK